MLPSEFQHARDIPVALIGSDVDQLCVLKKPATAEYGIFASVQLEWRNRDSSRPRNEAHNRVSNRRSHPINKEKISDRSFERS